MAQETLHKQRLHQSPANFPHAEGPPPVSTCQTSQSIAVGDFVHIQPGDTQLRLCIARVEGLFQDVGGKKFLNVRWYYRPEDLQHQPPCYPKEQEVYRARTLAKNDSDTDHLDCQLEDSIADICQVIFKTDLLKFIANERSIANDNNRTYICEFAYSAHKGVFSSMTGTHEFPSDSLSSAKLRGAPNTRGTATVAKELAEVLLDVEANIPKEILPISWEHLRQAWCSKTTNSKTIKELAQALLDLEDGVRMLNGRESQCPKDHTARRKTISGIHTYDLLAKYVKLFKLDVQHTIMDSMSNQPNRGIRHDHGLEKRKNVPGTKPKKLQKLDGIHSPFLPDPWINSGHSETRPFNVEVLPVSSNKQIVAQNIYKVDQEFLPLDAPTSLKFMRAVLVAETTRFNVTVTFPSMTSLQSYFGRAPVLKTEEHMTGISKLSSAKDQKKQTCTGTKPELDGHFNMTPKVAERVLIIPVSCAEYLHQGHLWCFWIIDDLEEESMCRRLRGDKDIATDQDLADETKGALGAAKALTQLIPGNTFIIDPDGNRAVNEGSSEYGSEGPLRSQIRWGIRSLRKASFANRSGNGTSPNSCDTDTKEGSNKGREKTYGRKFLDFSDQQHPNIGQTRMVHDFIPTEGSSRMHLRREEKFFNIGVGKCSDTSDKSDTSKHIRSNIILKLPKDMKGRWASERYKSAQLKLIDIMHVRGATPGKPILRPALREEARKDIGDTGLLDHLLKHMTDTVITNGERFRRRHNAEGAMEYWLEEASLMEIRKAAGIEDPSWIPPPGWQPGDAVPGRGEYGYGCFNRGMAPAEVAEMKKLKETVNKVRRDLQSLFLRVKRSRSREIPPRQKDDLPEDRHEIATKSNSASNVELEAIERIKLKERCVHGELNQKDQGDERSTQQQKSIGNTRFQERRSTCKIATETKSELETDLSELQKSVAMMQGYINNTSTELGFSHGEDINLTSKQVNSDDLKSRPTRHQLNFRSTALASPTAERNCSARTILTADINVRIPSEDTDSSRRKEAEFATSVGNEPNRVAQISQSNAGLNRAMTNGFVWNPASCGYFVRPGMIINQTGVFDGWAEDYLVPATLPPAANTTSFLGHGAETSREDASARVIYSITGSDYKNQFRPYFQHHENSFLQSTDSKVDTNSRNILYPDSVLEGDRAKGTAAEEKRFQPNGFHEATYQSEFQALAGVRREAAQARDGLAILSFAAGYEAIVKSSQEHDSALDIRGVSQTRVSAIANLKSVSSLVTGPTRRHLASVTVSPEARKCRTLHPVETNHLSTSSMTSSDHASADLSHSSLSAVPPAQCNRSESFQATGPIANRLFDEALANPTADSDSSRVEHLMVASVSKETPSVHTENDLSINLTLTSHASSKPGDSGSPCTSSKSVSGTLAEPSATIASRVVFAAEEGGNSGHTFAPHSSTCTGPLQCSQHADQLQVLSTKSFSKVRSSKQAAEIVIEKYSTKRFTNSSTWLGLAPPTSDNLHS